MSLKLLATAVLAGATSLVAGVNATHATDAQAVARMAPTKGVSFDIGTQRGVSYFLADSGACNLVVLLADSAEDEQPSDKLASRVSVSVAPGKSARIDTTGGKTLLFGCEARATAMTVQAADQVASARSRN